MLRLKYQVALRQVVLMYILHDKKQTQRSVLIRQDIWWSQQSSTPFQKILFWVVISSEKNWRPVCSDCLRILLKTIRLYWLKCWLVTTSTYTRPVITQDFFPDFRIFYKSPFASKCSLKEEKYPPRKERSNLYCVQTSSFLFVGMWRVCKSSKIKHPGVSWGFVL